MRSPVFITLSALVVALLLASVSCQIPSPDLNAIKQIGTAWPSLGWQDATESTDCGTLPGLICDGEGYVTTISLPEMTTLGGYIHPMIGNLSRLNVLNLSNITMSGTIPATLAQCLQLTTLTVDSNKLSGTIPAALGNLPRITQIDVSDNQLSGNLPEAFGNLVQLTTLDVSDNQLSGNLPEAFGKLVQLTTLSFGDNRFSGTIPSSFAALVNLEEFDVSGNDLSGTIPSSFSAFNKLTEFYADCNRGLNICPGFTHSPFDDCAVSAPVNNPTCASFWMSQNCNLTSAAQCGFAPPPRHNAGEILTSSLLFIAGTLAMFVF